MGCWTRERQSLAQIWNLGEDFATQLIQENLRTLCAKPLPVQPAPIQHGDDLNGT